MNSTNNQKIIPLYDSDPDSSIFIYNAVQRIRFDSIRRMIERVEKESQNPEEVKRLVQWIQVQLAVLKESVG